uniref:Uncharacterized protein n=1 Tax=Haemonchus contortus TaxID=6289 RepID=W6NGW8_HAECO
MADVRKWIMMDENQQDMRIALYMRVSKGIESNPHGQMAGRFKMRLTCCSVVTRNDVVPPMNQLIVPRVFGVQY